MIIEFGHFSLILALSINILMALYPLCVSLDASVHSSIVLRRLTHLSCLCVVLAFMTLLYAFWQTDFSVALAANHTHTTLPTFYKLTAVWGNHEGSMLLWILMQTVFAVFISRQARNGDKGLPFINRALVCQAVLNIGFITFTLLTSNPFARLVPAALEGSELNPLLQDVALVAHPPFLYMGYVGFSAIFSYAVAALWYGRIDVDWARLAKPIALIAWGALTVGITLGSLWAYYELGWGGFWFWDPVENASLIPWITATAFLHAVIVFAKRHVFPYWTLFLALSCFCFAMSGTFLVRSGILISVHSFASDPHRGLFILALIACYAAIAFSLFASRRLETPEPKEFYPFA